MGKMLLSVEEDLEVATGLPWALVFREDLPGCFTQEGPLLS